jgi:hypothetical protein
MAVAIADDLSWAADGCMSANGLSLVPSLPAGDGPASAGSLPEDGSRGSAAPPYFQPSGRICTATARGCAQLGLHPRSMAIPVSDAGKQRSF